MSTDDRDDDDLERCDIIVVILHVCAGPVVSPPVRSFPVGAPSSVCPGRGRCPSARPPPLSCPYPARAPRRSISAKLWAARRRAAH